MASLQPLSGSLGLRRAKHLLRRATFSLSKSTVDSLAQMNASSAFDVLASNPNNLWSEPYDPIPTGSPDGYWTSSTNPPNSFKGQGRKRMMVTGWWWMNSMQQASLKHKLTLFLHTSFTLSKDGGSGTSTHFFDHLRLLDLFAYGNLKALAKKITFDNSMLFYLDNTTNNANNPNENYAREFLELFTILKGPQIGSGDYTNYTEIDVQMAARVFSGIKARADRSIIDSETGIPSGYILVNKHDQNNKQFSHAFGNQVITGGNTESSIQTEIDHFINMIFDKDATAVSFCRKLYRFFVKSEWNTEVENDIILPLATQLKNDNYNILPTVKKLLTSQHFFDADDSNATDEIIGSKVKSPLQLVNELISHFGVTYNKHIENWEFYLCYLFIHNYFLQVAGMGMYAPDSVAGYPANYQEPDFDRHWFSSNTVVARYKLIQSIIDGRDRITGTNRLNYLSIDMVGYVNNSSNPNSAKGIVTEIANYLFPESIDDSRRDYFAQNLLEGYPDYYWLDAWSSYKITNDDTIVKARLNALITAMVNSAEFQIT